MPVYSMTGYASVQHRPGATEGETEPAALPKRGLGLEIRAVNSRFLDLTFSPARRVARRRAGVA